MILKRLLLAIGMAAGSLSHAAWAAEPQQSAIAQCITARTTGADRILTARWLFAAVSESPQMSDLSVVTPDQTKELNRGFAKLFTRLVTKDCVEEVRPLAAANFEKAFEQVGAALGETAMQELMSGKEVDASIAAYTDFFSKDDFEAFANSLSK